MTLDPDYPHLAYGADAKRSLMARAVIGKGARNASPSCRCLIDRRLRPEVLRADDARFDDAVRYMEWASEGFDCRFLRDEIVVT